MVRDRESGRFAYVEQTERRDGETPWECARRSFWRGKREGERDKVLRGPGRSRKE
jgi:hypothetical protein